MPLDERHFFVRRLVIRRSRFCNLQHPAIWPDRGFSGSWLELEDPGVVRITVERLGRIAQRCVDFDHLASNRRVDIRSSLDRLHNTSGVSGSKHFADFRQLDEDHIAQRFLCVVRDADGHGAICFNTCPFMTFGETQLGGNIAHLVILNIGSAENPP